jgi:hypothetical protein
VVGNQVNLMIFLRVKIFRIYSLGKLVNNWIVTKKEQIVERENFYYFGKKCNEKNYDK